MAEATIAADIHQPLDVLTHTAAEISLHPVIGINELAQAYHLCLREILDVGVGIHLCPVQDLLAAAVPDPIDVGQSGRDPFIPW